MPFGETQEDWLAWRDMIFDLCDIKLNSGNQEKFANDDSQHKILITGNQFGKSFVMGKIAGALATMPGKHIGILGAEMSFTKIEFDYALDLIEKLAQIGILNKSQIEHNQKDNMLRIHHGAKNEESWIKYDSFKKRTPFEGNQFDLIILAEASNPLVNVQWLIQFMPSRLMTRKGSYMIATTPLERGRLYKWIQKQKEKPNVYYVDGIDSSENPLLDPDVLAEIEADMPDLYARERLHGEWQNYGGLIMTAFDESMHIFEPGSEPKDMQYFGGYDFAPVGLQVLEIIGYSPSNNCYYSCAELVRESMPLYEFVDISKEFLDGQGLDWKQFTIYGDDATRAPFDEFRKAGFNRFMRAKKRAYANYHNDSVLMFNGLFDKGRWFVSSNCEELIDNCQNYAWNLTTGEPKKGHEDAIDATRYAYFGNLLIAQKVSVKDLFDVSERMKRSKTPDQVPTYSNKYSPKPLANKLRRRKQKKSIVANTPTY